MFTLNCAVCEVNAEPQFVNRESRNAKETQSVNRDSQLNRESLNFESRIAESRIAETADSESQIAETQI